MAEALLRHRLELLGVEARVSSAGELPGGVPAEGGSVRAMASRGLDLDRHRSRAFTAEHLGDADLVLAMARRHVREAVLIQPEAWPRTFTLKELVRRGEAAAPRGPGQSLAAWLALVHAGRRTADLLGEDPIDDIEDPIGSRDHVYQATAVELEDLIDRLVDLAFAPVASADASASDPAPASTTSTSASKEH
jgi:protein-tyrosine phosphatase